MRTSTGITEDSVQEAEQAAHERRQRRNRAYGLMRDRDGGYARLRPYYSSAAEVRMYWGADDSNLFKMAITPYGKKETISVILDAEEFRKWLRWV